MNLPRLTIAQKFIGYLIAFSVFPIVIVGVVSYITASNQLRRESDRYTSQLVQNQLDYLELQQSQVESLIANISGVEDIQETVSDESVTADSYQRLATQAQIGYILNSYLNISGLISIDILPTTARITAWAIPSSPTIFVPIYNRTSMIQHFRASKM